MKKLIFIGVITTITMLLLAAEKPEISIFYKNKKPSQQVLTKVDSLLKSYKNFYRINYYYIEDKKNTGLIKILELPQTHFPFAFAIDGKFTAKLENRTVSFVHFPKFMQGIGRHEGNWSLPDLEKVLKHNELLSKKNILPELDESSNNSDCEGED